MNAQMDKLKLEWLTRLVMGRDVFVFADELGPGVRFAHGIAECAPFLEPWAPGFQLRYFNGLLAWGVPLGRILARIPREDFLEVIRKADSPWVKGRPWPLAAIDWLARGKDSVARSILDKELLLLKPNDLQRMNAASIWRYLFNDSGKAHRELKAAGFLELADPEPDPYRNELARLWIEMFGDTERAGEMVRLERKAQAIAPDPYSFCQQALVGSLKMVLGDDELARKYLPDANCLGDVNCDWHGIDAAICWLALFDNPDMARACVEIGKTQPSENPATHAALCRYIFGDDASARSLLESRGVGKGWPQGVGPARWAEGWCLCFEDRGAAVAQLGKFHQNGNSAPDMAVMLAWRTLMNDNGRSDTVLMDLFRSMTFPLGNMLQYAELLVSECGEIDAARALLETVEGWHTTSLAMAECARTWWQALGDRVESERCLQKAWDVAQTAGDLQSALYIEELLSWKWSETL